jgi:hypothetical protein
MVAKTVRGGAYACAYFEVRRLEGSLIGNLGSMGFVGEYRYGFSCCWIAFLSFLDKVLCTEFNLNRINVSFLFI